jgi:hypothetical protein
MNLNPTRKKKMSKPSTFTRNQFHSQASHSTDESRGVDDASCLKKTRSKTSYEVAYIYNTNEKEIEERYKKKDNSHTTMHTDCGKFTA